MARSVFRFDTSLVFRFVQVFVCLHRVLRFGNLVGFLLHLRRVLLTGTDLLVVEKPKERSDNDGREKT
jgi:hypothetical protein